MTANRAWISLISKIIRQGNYTKPRGLTCKEIIGHTAVVDMLYPVVTARPKLGYRFLAAEAWWILSGRNDVKSIAPYSKHIANFSDNGETFFGAYGPKIIDQLPYIINSLVDDNWSRQAVLNIWRESPRYSKDIPCTISAQFLLRPDIGFIEKGSLQLHCLDTMRSSDAWLGWPYDVFNFSMLSAYIALAIRNKTGKKVTLGQLNLTAGSQHLYVNPSEDGNSSIPYCLSDALNALNDSTTVDTPYAPINLDDFESPACLVKHLGLCKDFKSVLPFLSEFKR